MRSRRVVRASDCQCRSRNSSGFEPSILRHNGSGGASNEPVLNKVPYIRKSQINPPVKIYEVSAELWRAYRRAAVAADPSAGALQASWPAAFPAYHQIDLKDIGTVLVTLCLNLIDPNHLTNHHKIILNWIQIFPISYQVLRVNMYVTCLKQDKYGSEHVIL